MAVLSKTDQKILDALKRGPNSPAKISAETGLGMSTVYGCLSKLSASETIKKSGGKRGFTVVYHLAEKSKELEEKEAQKQKLEEHQAKLEKLNFEIEERKKTTLRMIQEGRHEWVGRLKEEIAQLEQELIECQKNQF